VDKQLQLNGIIPAIVTPFGNSGGVDESTLRLLTGRLVETGIGGLVAGGSTGEFGVLTLSERRRVTEVVVESAGGRVPVIAQTGATSTRETITLTEHAEAVGASGVMVIPPVGEEPRWDDLVGHYRSVASSTTLPIVFYYIPSIHGYKLSVEQIGKLTEIDAIRFVKDSSGDMTVLTDLMRLYGDRVEVITAWDTLNLYGFVAGSSASISGSPNFIPDLWVGVCDAICKRADLEEGRRLWDKIWPICRFLEKEGYVAGVKAGCELVGIPVGSPRAPVTPLSADAKARLATLLANAGVIGSAA
jgi:dihydrodipicolinate synthase/N-acetylneuraminate lyase